MVVMAITTATIRAILTTRAATIALETRTRVGVIPAIAAIGPGTIRSSLTMARDANAFRHMADIEGISVDL